MQSHADDWQQKIKDFENNAQSKTQDGQAKLQQMRQHLSDLQSNVAALEKAGTATWNDVTSDIESAKQNLHELGGFFGK